MIAARELCAVGSVVKTHGIHGELNVVLEDPDVDLNAVPCVFFDMDGLKVPFFVDSCRSRGPESVLLTLDGVDGDSSAARFAGKTLYVRRQDLPADVAGDDAEGFYLEDLTGFAVVGDGRRIGIVEDFDDSTANVLMLVRDPFGKLLHIPAADEFFLGVDPDAKTITMNLPEGLLDI